MTLLLKCFTVSLVDKVQGYYSIREAAEKLGVSRSYAYYLVQTRRLKAETIGSQIVISQETIDQYLANSSEKGVKA